MFPVQDNNDSRIIQEDEQHLVAAVNHMTLSDILLANEMVNYRKLPFQTQVKPSQPSMRSSC